MRFSGNDARAPGNEPSGPDRPGGSSRARQPRILAARTLSLLLFVLFGFAAMSPPCEAHLAAHSTQQAHQHHSGSDPQQSSDNRHSGCTCLGDCHVPLSLDSTNSASSEVRAAAVHVSENAPPTPENQSVARINQPFVLPFATAPPSIYS
jgi:hypothetical protein